MKKRNNLRKTGKDLCLEEAEELKIVVKQYTDAQHGLEKVWQGRSRKPVEIMQLTVDVELFRVAS